MIASQHDWEEKRGFYLGFENSSKGDTPSHWGTLSLVLGIADGKEWRFISINPPWQLEKDYSLIVNINGEEARMRLDGELKRESKGGFLPSGGTMQVYFSPLWGRGRVDYLLVLKNLRITSGGKERAFSFPLLLPLFLFEPQCPHRFDWETKGEIKIEATFTILPYPHIKTFSPFVDLYGQCKYGDWEGKIKTDDDLKKALEEEERLLEKWGEGEGYDQFGGYELSDWKEEGTGFYRVVKRKGYWWLITPKGNPCFYIGLCGVPISPWEIMTPVKGREFLFEWLPPREGAYAQAWGRGFWGESDVEYVCFHISNMIRKYGENWREKEEEITRKRIKAWGFSGGGKWGMPEGIPYFPVLSRWDVPNIARHPDIFNPEVKAIFREALRRQIEPRKNDPFLVGWSLGNEYDEIITSEEIKEILGKGADVPAKRALVDYALGEIYKGNWEALVRAWQVEGKSREEIYQASPNPPSEDVEKLRFFYAENYYEFVYKTIKEIDPNHLFLGFWIIPGWWEKEKSYWEVFKLSARYCDVIGYNLAGYEFMSERFRELVGEVDKPIICGDFSFPSFYEGKRGFGVWSDIWARDDVEAGEFYERWVSEGAINPYCVGVLWFFYRDQPITGRGPCKGIDLVVRGPTAPYLVCGEHYAFGMVDVTDTPKWELVKRVRRANLSAIKRRLNIGE